MYQVDEDVEFYDEDRWVAAVVTKFEDKAISETDRRNVTNYSLRLKEDDQIVEYVLDNELRIPSLYQVNDEVDFYNTDGVVGAWIPAMISKVTYKTLSDSDHRQVPYYNLKLRDTNQDVEDALAADLQMHAQYGVDEEVEFYEKSAGAGAWVTAVVIDVKYGEIDGLRVPYYDLELTATGDTVRNTTSELLRHDIAALLDPDYQEGEPVEFYDDDGENNSWVSAIVTKAQYQEMSKDDHRQVPCYDLELTGTGDMVQHAFGSVLRPDIRALLNPVYLEGDEVLFHAEDDGKVTWLDAIVVQVEFKPISKNDPRQVPCYDLRLIASGDIVENAFGYLLRRDTKPTQAPKVNVDKPAQAPKVNVDKLTQAPKVNVDKSTTSERDESPRHSLRRSAPLLEFSSPASTHPLPARKRKRSQFLEKTPSQVRFETESSMNLPGDHHEDIFVLGDRVEVHRNNIWEPGMISHVSESDTTRAVLYSVRFDNMFYETGIEQSRVHGLFDQLGVQVSIRDYRSNWKWGIIVDYDTIGKTAAIGSRRYHILTRLNAPFDQVQCEPKDVMPFRHTFEQHEIVEMLVPDDDDELEAMSWQRATIEYVDKDTMKYTVSIGTHEWTDIEGSALRPLFMVGNFVRVLRHRITVRGFKGDPEWVKGVVASIQKLPYISEEAEETEGHMYQYSVLCLDKDQTDNSGKRLDIITVNKISTLVRTHLCMLLAFSFEEMKSQKRANFH